MIAWRWAAYTAALLLLTTVSSAEGAATAGTDRNNCTTLHKACTRCQTVSAYIGGSLVTRKVCRACNTQQGWTLAGQGSSMTCGERLRSIWRIRCRQCSSSSSSFGRVGNSRASPTPGCPVDDVDAAAVNSHVRPHQQAWKHVLFNYFLCISLLVLHHHQLQSIASHAHSVALQHMQVSCHAD